MPELCSQPDAVEIEVRDLILSQPKEGWTLFFRLYEIHIKNIIRRYHFNSEDNRDVFQEVVLRLSRDESHLIKSWSPQRCSLKGYLTVIVTSVCIDFFRSAFHRYSFRKIHSDDQSDLPLDILENLADPTPSPVERLQRLDLVSLLRRVIQDSIDQGVIDFKDLELIELRLEGLSYPEISSRIGISKESCATRFHRLREHLKKRLLNKNVDGNEPVQ